MRRTIVASLVGPILLFGCDSPSGSPAPLPAASAVASVPVPTSATPPVPPVASAAATPSASAAPKPPPETIVVQHILISYKGAKRAPANVLRTKAEARARATEALAKLKAGAEFEELVPIYSEDPGSIDRRGLVGKMHRADMPPAFSTAAFALQVDQVSDVVETQFGFHIIKRTQ